MRAHSFGNNSPDRVPQFGQRPQKAKIIKGKSSKGSKQPDVHYGTRIKPQTNPPET